MRTALITISCITIYSYNRYCAFAQYRKAPNQNVLSSLIYVPGQSKANKTINISWNITSGQCSPAICDDSDINDIPDFVDKLPVKVLSEKYLNKIWDYKSTRRCFSRINLCVYGDSTIEETINDIIIILSGTGRNSSAVKQYFKIIKQKFFDAKKHVFQMLI